MTTELDKSAISKGVVLAVLGTFLFALKSIFIKLAYADGAGVESVLVLRMLLAAPFYGTILFFLLRKVCEGEKYKKISAKGIGSAMALGFFGYYLASYLDLAGLQHISAQLERLTLFTYPTMIAILAACFLKEAFTRWVFVSLLLCYLGLWMMYGEEVKYFGSEGVGYGVLLVLGSALSYSIYVIMAKPMIQRYGSTVFTSVAMLGSTLFVVIHAIVTEGSSVFAVSGKVYVYAFILAFVCTVIPSYMITAAIGMIGATRTSILGTVGPVFTIILAVVLLGEPFGVAHILGVSLILTGVICVTFSKKEAVK